MVTEDYTKPGVGGIFVDGDPGYSYMGSKPFMQGVQFTYPALQQYAGQNLSQPDSTSSADIPFLAYSPKDGEVDWRKLATGKRFVDVSDALGRMEKMYKSLVGLLHPQAATSYKEEDTPMVDTSLNIEDPGYPRLFIMHKNLPNAVARYVPQRNLIEYPAYENIFTGGGYYPKNRPVIGQEDGVPVFVDQQLVSGDIRGPLRDTAYSHELGHALDFRSRPNYDGEIVPFISNYADTGLWPRILRMYAAENDDYLSKKTDAPEAFAEAFERGINQQLENRYKGLGDIPYGRETDPVAPDEFFSDKFARQWKQQYGQGQKAYRQLLPLSEKNTLELNQDLYKPNIINDMFRSLGLNNRSVRAGEPVSKAMRKMRSESKKAGPANELSGFREGFDVEAAKDSADFIDYFFKNIYPNYRTQP